MSLGPAEILVLAVVVLVFIGPGDSRKRLDTADQRGRTRAVTSPT